MNTEHFMVALAKIMQVPPEAVTESYALDSNGNWDSLAVMGTIAMVDAQFNITIPANYLLNCKSVKELIDLVTARLPASVPATADKHEPPVHTSRKSENIDRFSNLSFEDFRLLAKDDTLSPCEKIGFPNEYREGKESLIFDDIVSKVPVLLERGKTVLDIGPGCSGLAEMLVRLCRDNGHKLVAVDSPEMLQHLPNEPFITKIAGRFPDGCRDFIAANLGRFDVILTYSVFHYVYAEINPFDFLDMSMALLSEGGQMLIGDIPSASKRKRFFSSGAGIAFHQNFTQTTEVPKIAHNCLEPGKIDDAVLLGILQHCRLAGFDAYLLPQPVDLPMANRREDILVTRP